MATNIFPGNNGGIAKLSIGFVAAGITPENTEIIHLIGNPYKSYDPKEDFNSLNNGFEKDEKYNIVAKQTMDLEDIFQTKSGAETVTPGEGVPAVYQFNSANQTISITNPTDFNFPLAQSWAIGFFLKSPLTGVLRIGTSTDDKRMWDISVEGSGPDVVLSAYMENVTDGSTNYKSTTLAADKHITSNVFAYAVVTWNGTALKVYLNGQDVSFESNGGTVTALATGGEFRMGKFLTYTSSGGVVIDSLWVANVAPDASQVTALFTNTPVNITNKPWFTAATKKGYWTFDHNLLDEYSSHNGTATAPLYVN